MAKKGLQDIRVNFIEAIGRTENLRVLRSICSNIYSRKFSFNPSDEEIMKFYAEGYSKIIELLGSEAKEEFAPIVLMDSMGVKNFFDKLTIGYREMDKRELKRQSLEKERLRSRDKYYKAKDRGKLDVMHKYEKIFQRIEHPVETKKRLIDAFVQLETSTKSEDIINIAARKKEIESEIDKCNQVIKVYQIKESQVNNNKVDKHVEKKKLDISDCNFSLTRQGILDKYSNKEAEDLIRGMDDEVRFYFAYKFFKEVGRVSDTENKFLSTYDGDIVIDYEHMLVLYNYLKDKNCSFINEVKGILCYTFLVNIAKEMLRNRHSGEINVFIKENPTEFTCDRIPCYERGYTPYYLLPKGYRGLVFEPTSLNQQSLISAIDKDDLNVEMMVGKYKEAQTFMNRRKKGILFDFLPKELENKLMPYLITSEFALHKMNGVFSEPLLREFLERRATFGDSNSSAVMTNMYMRVVKPYNLEVLGSYVRTFCSNLSKLKDKDAIFIYYISPQRFAIAVRDDITDENLKEVFDERFLNVLKEVKKPTLDDFLVGEYL